MRVSKSAVRVVASHALPDVAELRALLVAALPATDAFAPVKPRDVHGVRRGPGVVPRVYEMLSEPFSSPDEDADLSMFDALDHAFVERQIARGAWRTARQAEPRTIGNALPEDAVMRAAELTRVHDRVLRGDANATLVVLMIEAPLVGRARDTMLLRMQCYEGRGAEDYAYCLKRVRGTWTRS